jgi:hypothetical protein
MMRCRSRDGDCAAGPSALPLVTRMSQGADRDLRAEEAGQFLNTT